MRLQTVLLDKEETGCRALLREEKTEDLRRMHKLFQRLPNSATCGLQPISQIVREHIVDVGMSLVPIQFPLAASITWNTRNTLLAEFTPACAPVSVHCHTRVEALTPASSQSRCSVKLCRQGGVHLDHPNAVVQSRGNP